MSEMTSELHVATTGSDTADGSAERPFRTINRAAALARPGDTVVVHAGGDAWLGEDAPVTGGGTTRDDRLGAEFAAGLAKRRTAVCLVRE